MRMRLCAGDEFGWCPTAPPEPERADMSGLERAVRYSKAAGLRAKKSTSAGPELQARRDAGRAQAQHSAS